MRDDKVYMQTKFGNYSLTNYVVQDCVKRSFWSYDQMVAEFDPSKNQLTLLSDLWDYSQTTRYYFKRFINHSTSFTYGSRQQWLKLLENAEIVSSGCVLTLPLAELPQVDPDLWDFTQDTVQEEKRQPTKETC